MRMDDEDDEDDEEEEEEEEQEEEEEDRSDGSTNGSGRRNSGSKLTGSFQEHFNKADTSICTRFFSLVLEVNSRYENNPEMSQLNQDFYPTRYKLGLTLPRNCHNLTRIYPRYKLGLK